MKILEVPIVKGHRILVEVEGHKDLPKLERIVLPESVTDRRMQGCEIGHVVTIGPDAFVRRGSKEPWCLPQDYILFIQYAGQAYVHPETKKLYRIINEEDVLAVVGKNDSEIERENNE